MDQLPTPGETPIPDPSSQSCSEVGRSPLSKMEEATVETRIREALLERPDELVLAWGKGGLKFARERLGIPGEELVVVEIEGPVDFALRCVEKLLDGLDYRLPKLWVIGQAWDLVEILEGKRDTTLPQALEVKGNALPPICRLATELNMPEELVKKMEDAETVETLIQIVEQEPLANGFWQVVEFRIGYIISGRIGNVRNVVARLFDTDGRALGVTA